MRGLNLCPLQLSKFKIGRMNDAFNFLGNDKSWISILSVSTRFDMKQLRYKAIQQLDHGWGWGDYLDAVDRAVLAVQYDIAQWLPIAYRELAQRKEPIEVEEARKLGIDVTCLLAKARESLRCQKQTDEVPAEKCKEEAGDIPTGKKGKNKKSSSPSASYAQGPLVDRIIQELFWPTPEPPMEPAQPTDPVS